MFNGKSVLITGGTGSLGRALVASILKQWPAVKRLVVFSRDELKQYEMSREFPASKYPSLRYFLGDVRDQARLRRAFNRIEIVIHAAALKQVPAAEYNPIEFVHTNVIGAQNVVEAAIDSGVATVVALSTDKAAAPINLYGATKLCSDKLFVAANTYAAPNLRSMVVRYGNVMASRGSVIPFFLEKASSGILPITHAEMTRFNISVDQGVDMIFWAIQNALGGEIFVPKIPSYRILDLAEAIGPNCQYEIIGIRPGEKIHEEMITSSDSQTALDLGDYYAILPADQSSSIEDYSKRQVNTPTSRLSPGFSYHSGRNDQFLTVDELRGLIVKHVDPEFSPH